MRGRDRTVAPVLVAAARARVRHALGVLVVTGAALPTIPTGQNELMDFPVPCYTLGRAGEA